MAIIVVELNTEDAGDRRILDVVNDLVSRDVLQGGVSLPLETVETRKVKVNPPTPLKIVPEPTGSSIADELKQELADIDAETEPTPADIFTAPPPPAPDGTTPAPPPSPPVNPDATVSSIELDSDGLPWDARIHASTKTKIVSGQWKAKRKVSADTISIVTEELRSVMRAPTVVALAPAPAPDDGSPKDFGAFVQAMVKIGKTNKDVDPILAEYGIKGLNLLGARPDLIPEIWARLTV
jgi:hypothetical protein